MRLFLDKYPLVPLNQKRSEGKRVCLCNEPGQRNPHCHWDSGAIGKNRRLRGRSREGHERERRNGEHHHLLKFSSKQQRQGCLSLARYWREEPWEEGKSSRFTRFSRAGDPYGSNQAVPVPQPISYLKDKVDRAVHAPHANLQIGK
jgi:hypothetical protein